jgi:hypothetical protein
MKHINIKYHHICEIVAEGILHINEVNTKENLADILTKALPRSLHSQQTLCLGLQSTSIAGEYREI